jgi:hypothetical protein
MTSLCRPPLYNPRNKEPYKVRFRADTLPYVELPAVIWLAITKGKAAASATGTPATFVDMLDRIWGKALRQMPQYWYALEHLAETDTRFQFGLRAEQERQLLQPMERLMSRHHENAHDLYLATHPEDQQTLYRLGEVMLESPKSVWYRGYKDRYTREQAPIEVICDLHAMGQLTHAERKALFEEGPIPHIEELILRREPKALKELTNEISLYMNTEKPKPWRKLPRQGIKKAKRRPLAKSRPHGKRKRKAAKNPRGDNWWPF